MRTPTRSAPRNAETDTGLYFPPEKVHVLAHPELGDLGPTERNSLLVHRLYSYLQFTAKLERHAINPVVLDLADGRHGFSMPSVVRRDADKIYTDEAWHAQFSNELVDRVQEETDIAAPVGVEPMFLIRLRELKAQHPEHASMIDLFYAIVSETLISTLLVDIPADERLVMAVRNDVADHARDEAAHNAFFSDLLRVIWPQLGPDTVRFIGPQISKFIIWFLEPTPEIYVAPMERLGFSSPAAWRIAQESVALSSLRKSSRRAADKTLRLLAEVGAFADRGTRNACEDAGLLIPAAVARSPQARR